MRSVVACYMVMQIHSGELYYNTGSYTGEFPKNSNMFWIGIYNALCRTSVPLFVMMSGYLLLPVKTY